MIYLVYLLGFTIQQSDFTQLITYYGVFFSLYLGIIYFVKEEGTISYFIGLGILLRFILIFAFPNLSDDIFRFIWDGRLITQGINPFNHLPTYFLEAENQIPGLTDSLFRQLNSPEYYTIYPPLSQAIFSIACWITPDNISGSAVIMKSFMFLFECATIVFIVKLLQHFNLPARNVLIYALNPLIIIEITGNLHFEGVMIFFLLLAIWLFVKQRNNLSAIAFGLAVVSKLLPLMFLPFMIKRLGWKKSLFYFSIVGGTILLCFTPLLNATFLSNFGNSLDLYFQKFEFNASIYYVLRWIGTKIVGYNLISTIGPLLGLTVLGSICYKAYKEQKPNFENLFTAFLFAITIYLLLATTIHPWYLAMPLVLCLFTRYRFPVIWSGVIMLTYINYSYPEYFENLWIVGLEYVIIIGWFLFELKGKKVSIIA